MGDGTVGWSSTGIICIFISPEAGSQKQENEKKTSKR